MQIFVRKPPGFRKLGHSSEMENDALMHREGLNGYNIFSCLLCINAVIVT